MTDAGMPMPALVLRMPMPSYVDYLLVQRGKQHDYEVPGQKDVPIFPKKEIRNNCNTCTTLYLIIWHYAHCSSLKKTVSRLTR
jgi:hypothetical protein